MVFQSCLTLFTSCMRRSVITCFLGFHNNIADGFICSSHDQSLIYITYWKKNRSISHSIVILYWCTEYDFCFVSISLCSVSMWPSRHQLVSTDMIYLHGFMHKPTMYAPLQIVIWPLFKCFYMIKNTFLFIFQAQIGSSSGTEVPQIVNIKAGQFAKVWSSGYCRKAYIEVLFVLYTFRFCFALQNDTVWDILFTQCKCSFLSFYNKTLASSCTIWSH